MSITFSSSENNYWCFFFIIIATRRKRRTQRDSETRERNEEKRIFCDRKTDELRTHRRFYHPRPFRRRLRNDLRDHLYILLHHRSTSRSRRRTHSARARVFFFSSLPFTRAVFTNENKRRKKTQSARAQVNCFLVRDRSERSQIPIPMFHHHRSTLGEKKPKKKKNRESSSSSSSSSSKARTFSFLYLYLGALYLSKKSARIFYAR